MLKALELLGFKSFADRTRFEFPPGITVVVGPNGSGKSNVVDAIKWVLGEQSAKSLRGREMADVIFNGSASRPPLNTAETTLTFDNSQGLLALDAPEVHITRRVYRSGEGEYLINRQPCRLRDIRELFSGTGIATEAYSIIEQGKVDVLLQSSPRDRRLIFEEAAGISRFKAKKVEALRRLERVEQNLLRLADIVDEVDHQLKSLRRQAAKAQRYRELADRLQSLRTQLGLADWRALGRELAAVESEIAELRASEAQVVAEAERQEALALALDGEVTQVNEAWRLITARSGENREQIAVAESTIEHERQRGDELSQEIARHERQLLALSVRAGDLVEQLAATARAQSGAVEQHQTVRQQLTDQERALSELTARCDLVRAAEERARAALAEARSAVAAGERRASALESQEAAATLAAERARQRLGEARQAGETLAGQAARLEAELDQRSAQRAAAGAELEDARRELTAARTREAATRENLAQLREQHRGRVERASLLEELEHRLEGLGAGVKEVLVRARAAKDGPFRQVRGLVADLIQVPLDVAGLIDLALGEAAEHVVLAPGDEFFQFLVGEAPRFPGRVAFARADLTATVAADSPALEGRPGVVSRADRLVEAAPEYQPLVARLLGRTWLVERLETALELSAGIGAGEAFVTLAGEALSAEGVLTVGGRQASLGLVSRRSELRTLRAEAAQLEAQITAAAEALAERSDEIQVAEGLLAEQQQIVVHHEQALAGLRLEHSAVTARQAQLDEQALTLSQEVAIATAQHATAQHDHAAAREQLTAAERRLGELQGQGQDRGRELRGLEEERARRLQASTLVQVELAKCEERLANLDSQRRQLERDQEERRRALAECRQQWTRAQERAREAERNILAAESLVAELYLRKESLAVEADELVTRRDELRTRRLALAEEAQQVRARARELASRAHAQELQASQWRAQREGLEARLREDYALELAQLAATAADEPPADRAAAEQEAADLKQKLQQLGHVNLDALDELGELEARHEGLVTQLRDLTSAKNSLEQIIQRINADSRRLFIETFETVRGHFQELFRKLFGGGQADVLLDEAVDVLDSGIEIVARPPGKEPRNISLLSGGEKTLTCVALLLAVFRSRPSPFCVLDEVDAALDEANIERFIGVLRDFLAWTQFVIVTHSKKTMTAATSLYGVTMQESGVSKRVSVRFDDVSDNGEIRLNPRDDAGSDGSQAA